MADAHPSPVISRRSSTLFSSLKTKRSFQRSTTPNNIHVSGDGSPTATTTDGSPASTKLLRSPFRPSSSSNGRPATSSGINKMSQFASSSLLGPTGSTSSFSILEAAQSEGEDLPEATNGGAPRKSEAVRTLRHPPSLKKLANSFSGAWSSTRSKTQQAAQQAAQQQQQQQQQQLQASTSSSRSSTSTDQKGFEFSDWNNDLAAIASHPTPGGGISSPPPNRTRATRSRSNSSTGTASVFGRPQRMELLSPGGHSSNLDDFHVRTLDSSPVAPSPESRRRKSDELEDDHRMIMSSFAPPVKRGDLGHSHGGHGRSHSLAHAHAFRGSRTLAQQARAPIVGSGSMDSHPTIVPSSSMGGFSSGSPSMALYSTRPPAPSLLSSPFASPFGAPRSSASAIPTGLSSSSFGGSLPASTRVSLEGLGSIADEDESGDSSTREDGGENLFESGLLVSHAQDGSLGSSISRRSRRSSCSLSASSSLSSRKHGRLGPPLATPPILEDSSAVVFHTPSTTGPSSSATGLANLARSAQVSRVVTSSASASPFFSNFGAAGSTSQNVPPPVTSQGGTFPSRRAASLDSVFLASVLHGPPSPASSQAAAPQHPPRPFTARKRSANGVMLAGGSRLAAVSPVNASHSSPGPAWAAGEGDRSFGTEEDDSDTRDSSMEWTRSTDGAPGLTDGATTSASSSLSTSLSRLSEKGNEPAVIIADAMDGQNGALADKLQEMAADNDDGGITDKFLAPQNYGDVMPLQAAFMSTGLVSKKSRPRTSNGNGAPLGLSISTDDQLSAAVDPLAPPVTAISNPHFSALAMSQMPDTPVKRAALGHATAATPDVVVDLVDRLDPATTGSPMPVLSAHAAMAMITDKLDSPLGCPSSGGSSTSSPLKVTTTPSSRNSGDSEGGEMSPTVLASQMSVSRDGRSLGKASATTGRRPLLFRRRSSGQLENDGSFLGVRSSYRTNSSSSTTSTVGGEPMTPTRNVFGTAQKDGPQLVNSPAGSPLTPATSTFPPAFQIFAAAANEPVSPPLATPLLRQSFPLTTIEQAQYGPNSRPPLSAAGRPQFRQRHSGSTLLSMRQRELQQPSWFEANYTIIKSIGKGAFSEAYEVEDRQRGSVYAVKRTKQPFSGPKDRLRRLEEVDILRLVSAEGDRSPHIITLIDAWEQHGHLFIETEICENGNLAFFLEEYGRLHEILDEARVWKILAEITSGVAHLHDRGVIHLDLKPANIFINDWGHLLIGDFGLATRWPRTDALSIMRGANVLAASWDHGSDVWPGLSGSSRRVRAKSSGDTASEFEREGDREYIAPEILAGRYGKEADLFSVGLIVLEAAANVILPDNGPSWHKLRSNNFDDVDLARLSPDLRNLILRMLDSNPDRRATIGDVTVDPVVSRLQSMLDQAFELRKSMPTFSPSAIASAHGRKLPILGAILPENDTFIQDVFTQVFSYDGDVSVGHEGDESLERDDDEMDVDA